MNKKILILLPLLLALGLIFFVQTNKNPSVKEPLLGGDKDEHGCVTSAGYSWCQIKQKCLRSWEETCDTRKEGGDSQMIKEALVAKHGWNREEIEVNISKNDGKYATGGVGSKTPQGGGGIWFAAKKGESWQIVWDGNGVVMCEDLNNYQNFPVDLIPECYDPSLNKMVKR